MIPATIGELEKRLDDQDYFADESLVVAIHLAVQLGKPLFLEGEAGVGKTEVAKVLAAMARGGAHPAPVLRGTRRRDTPSMNGTTPAR